MRTRLQEDPGSHREIEKLTKVADKLTPFEEMLYQLSRAPEDADYPDRCAEVAQSMEAIGHENGGGKLASAARFWQAFALAEAGRRDKALVVLPNALTTPVELPYDFMGNLLRIRLLAENDQAAVAMTSALRLRSSYPRWFLDSPATGVQPLVLIVVCRAGQAWLSKYETSSSEATTEIQNKLQAIRRELSHGSRSPELYVLHPAVPALFDGLPPITREISDHEHEAATPEVEAPSDHVESAEEMSESDTQPADDSLREP
jgi:hypothetical protein